MAVETHRRFLRGANAEICGDAFAMGRQQRFIGARNGTFFTARALLEIFVLAANWSGTNASDLIAMTP